jgi:molecular chaperone GrpE
MSFSDETTPEEEVTPESPLDGDEVWSEADSTALEAEADPMAQLKGERDEFLAALQRTQADFENYRKRVQRTQEEQSARAAADLVVKLLPALDTLDLAFAHQSESAAENEDAKALKAVRTMLLDALSKEGLERLDQVEVEFDPSVHDAVSRSGDEGGDVVIDQVLRSGYRWRGQVVRPAMVSVRG